MDNSDVAPRTSAGWLVVTVAILVGVPNIRIKNVEGLLKPNPIGIRLVNQRDVAHSALKRFRVGDHVVEGVTNALDSEELETGRLI